MILIFMFTSIYSLDWDMSKSVHLLFKIISGKGSPNCGPQVKSMYFYKFYGNIVVPVCCVLSMATFKQL